MAEVTFEDREMETDAFIIRDEVPVKPVLLSQRQQRLARLQFFALCWSLAILGWNDGSTGPLLPRIQKVYNVSLRVNSLFPLTGCQ